MDQANGARVREHPVRIPIGNVWLDGDLALPVNAQGIVLFAHGSGSFLVTQTGG